LVRGIEFPGAEPGVKPVRVMTYNVHSCVGTDGRHDLDRIAEVIAQLHPDMVALQELDHGYSRSKGVHQAREIAERLQFGFQYHVVREVEDERFGNAILCRYPMKLIRAAELPGTEGRRQSEKRGALWVEVESDGGPIQLLNTHLGLRSRERIVQVNAILGPVWLGMMRRDLPFILCGDLNCGPNSLEYKELTKHFLDCQLQPRSHKPRNTWMSHLPLRRIDHILVSAPLAAQKIEVPSSFQVRMASDHLPLVAEIVFGKGVKRVA
jgi:endonuclease/exonuclease/phosphatase family metal-dependent hydrolase